jgi:hypothetical protein
MAGFLLRRQKRQKAHAAPFVSRDQAQPEAGVSNGTGAVPFELFDYPQIPDASRFFAFINGIYPGLALLLPSTLVSPVRFKPLP